MNINEFIEAYVNFDSSKIESVSCNTYVPIAIKVAYCKDAYDNIKLSYDRFDSPTVFQMAKEIEFIKSVISMYTDIDASLFDESTYDKFFKSGANSFIERPKIRDDIDRFRCMYNDYFNVSDVIAMNESVKSFSMGLDISKDIDSLECFIKKNSGSIDNMSKILSYDAAK